MLQANNLLNQVLQVGGAFHAGVEVYGAEHAYGVNGIQTQAPRMHDVHIYRQSV